MSNDQPRTRTIGFLNGSDQSLIVLSSLWKVARCFPSGEKARCQQSEKVRSSRPDETSHNLVAIVRPRPEKKSICGGNHWATGEFRGRISKLSTTTMQLSGEKVTSGHLFMPL